MKHRIFTLLIMAVLTAAMSLNAQLSSNGWGNLVISDPLVLDDNFQGYPFFHSDENPDQGNSSNEDLANPGYMNRTDFKLVPASKDTIFYEFYQCAFAPEWISAYAFRDTVEMEAGITPGFVEISREYESHLTVNGYFIIDLRQMAFVDAIQWTHSSCGGTKRGFTLEVSTDDSVTWDTLRAQTTPMENSMGELATEYSCQESAYGLKWEDYVLASNVMLRFTKSIIFGQAVRIHDLKIYATPMNSTVSVRNLAANEIGIVCIDRRIRLTEPADIGIYSLSGALLKRANGVDTYGVSDLPDGLYIVRAKTDSQITTRKVLLK